MVGEMTMVNVGLNDQVRLCTSGAQAASWLPARLTPLCPPGARQAPRSTETRAALTAQLSVCQATQRGTGELGLDPWFRPEL